MASDIPPRVAHGRGQQTDLPAAAVQSAARAPGVPRPGAARATPHAHRVARPPTQAGLAVEPQPRAAAPPAGLPPLQVIGQAQGRYIVADGPDGIYVIDQHAAHERVVYERLLGEHQATPLRQQLLLLPATIPLAPPVARLLGAQPAALVQWGFTVEADVAAATVVVRAVPAGLREAAIGPALGELGEQVRQAGGTPPDWREQALATVACHSAVRAGQRLSGQEMAELLQDLQRCTAPRTCAHGRPTFQIITAARLTQFFAGSG